MKKRKIIFLFLILSAIVGNIIFPAHIASAKITKKNINAETAIAANREKQIIIAIEKRDDAIIAALEKYSSGLKIALETRKKQLADSWNITNQQERKKSIKNTWNNYETSLEKLRKDFKNEKNSAWKQFYSDRKDAGKDALSDDRTTEGIDNTI